MSEYYTPQRAGGVRFGFGVTDDPLQFCTCITPKGRSCSYNRTSHRFVIQDEYRIVYMASTSVDSCPSLWTTIPLPPASAQPEPPFHVTISRSYSTTSLLHVQHSVPSSTATRLPLAYPTILSFISQQYPISLHQRLYPFTSNPSSLHSNSPSLPPSARTHLSAGTT